MRRLSWASIARLFSLFATFALSAIVGQTLGADAAGVFFYLTTLLYVSSTVARFGVDNYLLRLTASDDDTLILKASVSLAVYLSFALTIVAALVLANVDIGVRDLGFGERLLFASTLMPFSGLVMIGAFLRVRGFFVNGILIELGLPPTILALLIVGFGWLQPLTVDNVVSLYVLSIWITFAYALISLRKAHNRFIGTGLLRVASLPRIKVIPVKQLSLIMLTSLVYLAITWAPVLVIGNSQVQSSEIGYLYVAIRIAGIVTIIPSIQSSTFGPAIAEKIREFRLDEANQMAAVNVRYAAAFGSVLAAIIVISAPMAVPILYGNSFAPAVVPVIILSVGAVASICFGQVVFMMQLTGNLKFLVVILTATLFTWLLVGPSTAASFGATGIAVLLVSSNVVTSAILALRLWKSSGIRSYLRTNN